MTLLNFDDTELLAINDKFTEKHLRGILTIFGALKAFYVRSLSVPEKHNHIWRSSSTEQAIIND